MGKKSSGVTYAKSQFLASQKYTPSQKDAINALLDEETKYAVAEVNHILDQFATKEVV
ncbi:hypothetical protein [Cohnella lupini]|uniref:Uncharacterized protein n=1 Tax=Cohnella lupini TaxID=1294267 RepID=A0A3D9ISJ1_9BACL|nr:hypothetical protein [Cohnella lupini]RED64668.1 hypothetical protein DFP95_10288 [Cohnella lupini]